LDLPDLLSYDDFVGLTSRRSQPPMALSVPLSAVPRCEIRRWAQLSTLGHSPFYAVEAIFHQEATRDSIRCGGGLCRIVVAHGYFRCAASSTRGVVGLYPIRGKTVHKAPAQKTGAMPELMRRSLCALIIVWSWDGRLRWHSALFLGFWTDI